ncbi:MAG: glycosyltransferase family 2 protein [Bacteroidales bacterium]|jgi:glycosyltransferase involved in cell wall biosynthesis|nr:glycosyltransferase family 2 protein [Bacteroidales bacterium]
MKKISIVVPCYNEEKNVENVVNEVTELFRNNLDNYDYEILFIDNCSKDKTQEKLEYICSRDKKIKAIFNAANFTAENSMLYGLIQSTGDCAIILHADLQYPVSKIPEFIKAWEDGHTVVCGVKEKTSENIFMHFLRILFYKMIRSSASVRIVNQFTGYGLYDRNFIKIIDQVHDPLPIFRGVIGEYAKHVKTIPFPLGKRKFGITSAPVSRLYDIAWLNLTSYSKVAIRWSMFFGLIGILFSIIFSIYFIISKFINWDVFPPGIPSIVICVCFFGGIQLIILSVLGEYIYTINQRLMKLNRPIVIEEKRINFEQ